MDSLRITLEIPKAVHVSQSRRRRRRPSQVFWYFLPLPPPVSINAADTTDADRVIATDADAANAADAADAADAATVFVQRRAKVETKRRMQLIGGVLG